MANLNQYLDKAYLAKFRATNPNVKDNSEDCSGFLQSLMQELNISLPPDANADGIIDFMKQNWKHLGNGDIGLQQAMKAAQMGKLIIVGAKSKDYGARNGHVAVVLAKTHNGLPYIYGGAMAPIARTQGSKTLNYVFSRKYFPKLAYFEVPGEMPT